ncbi:hypothetical protein AB0C34_30905 [Nocardia sp. NPDC049220]|uniref:hypothetical protein n=1 Tax=Nocardia sp. NPDC049220 TaxID=3155273 RepID=UPI0033CE7BE6
MTSKPTTPTEAIMTGLGHLVIAAVSALFLLVKWAVLFPMLSAPVVAVVVAALLWGWLPALLTAVLAVTALLVWWRVGDDSFYRWVTHRVQGRWTVWRIYGRQWSQCMTACKLHITSDDGRTRTPALLSVTLDNEIDRVVVRMLPGQCPEDYHARRARLAVAFEALDCRTRLVGPSAMELVLQHREIVTDPVPAASTKVEWLWKNKEAA